MRRVEIILRSEKGVTGTVLDAPPNNGDDILVNLDSVYGRVNSRFNRVLSFTEQSVRDI